MTNGGGGEGRRQSRARSRATLSGPPETATTIPAWLTPSRRRQRSTRATSGEGVFTVFLVGQASSLALGAGGKRGRLPYGAGQRSFLSGPRASVVTHVSG